MNLSQYSEEKPHRTLRLVWAVVNVTLFRILISRYLRIFRNLLLRLFGAKLPLHIEIYPSVTIYAPWNLEVGPHSCIGPGVEIYNKARVQLKDNVVISQYSKIYTASHNIMSVKHSLIIAPVVLESRSWIGADAFVGMGVTIGEGAVVGARAAVFKDVEPWTVVGGNPAKFIKKRELTNPI